jgi:hypothetical protein
VAVTAHDGKVNLDRHARPLHREPREQLPDREARGNFRLVAVDHDLHGAT